MLKKLVTILFTIFILPKASHATSAFTERKQSKNCAICTTYGDTTKCFSGIGSHLNVFHIQSLFIYLEDNYLAPDEHIEINFCLYSKYYTNDTINGILPYSLGYDYRSFNLFTNNKKRLDKKKLVKTIILNVRTNSFNVQECLKLLMYGLANRNQIEKLQKKIAVQHVFDGNDSILTISKHDIDNILKIENPFINSLLKHKTYRLSTPVRPKDYGLLDIYTQNDSFYLYETKNLKSSYYDLRNYLKKDFKTDTLNTSLFSFSEMTDFTSDKQDNYLVFNNDRTFYHIVLHNKKISGPYTLPKLGNKFDEYSRIVDSFSKKGDTIILRMDTGYSDGSYYILFNTKTGKAVIDSASMGFDIKAELKAIREINAQIDAELKTAQAFAMRKYYMIALAIVVIALNLFLAYSKRL